MSTVTKTALRTDALPHESMVSAVSWPAVIAGSFVAAALSLSLLLLGTGLGLAAISPWSNEGASTSGVSMASVAWVIIMQILAAALGGYLAGRLRTKWTDARTDEVFFRDTAHGFLVWAVGLVITATLLATAAASIIGGAANVGATTAANVATIGATAMADKAQGSTQSSPTGEYWVDTLFRSNRAKTDPNDAIIRTEVMHILANDGTDITPGDKSYLTQLIASKTGVDQAEADRRIGEMVTRIKAGETEARQAADTARKAATKLSLWLFVGLLAGAFCASYAATLGGRQRDFIA